MNLSLKHRAHRLDKTFERMGTRLLVLDVKIDATPSDVDKLERFMMMKKPFFSIPETKSGAEAFGVSLAAGIGAYLAWSMLDSATPSLVMAGVSCAGLWATKRTAGRPGVVDLKVKDVINTPVPFVRDNPADIHVIAEQVTEKYQGLFGAMFEIEAFGSTREVNWNQEVCA